MYNMDEFKKESLKDNFFELMMEYPYAKDPERKKQIINKAIKFTNQIPEFKGWPQDDKAFWNAESFMWHSKINKELRKTIQNELSKRTGQKNLDLGSGNVAYTNSTVVDYSPEMLDQNPNPDKVLHNLEEPLPFDTESFDSVSAVFVFNYISNVPNFIKEIKRVLITNGKLTIVQPEKVNHLYNLHVKNNYDEASLRVLLKKSGFRTESTTKKIGNNQITFYFCEKKFS
ncbi:class I SAM-dependent methyltransferase [Nanoarchaeota archaeon]